MFPDQLLALIQLYHESVCIHDYDETTAEFPDDDDPVVVYMTCRRCGHKEGFMGFIDDE